MAPFADTVTVLRRRWGVALGACALLVLALVPLVGALSKGAAELGPGGVSFLAALALAALVPAVLALARLSVARDATEVEATPEGLRVRGALVLARAQLAEGYVVQKRGGRYEVRLVGQKGGASMTLEFKACPRAIDLLRALELDVLHRVLELKGLCNYEHVNVPARIVVGADGVLVTYAGFFSYASLASIEREGAVVVLKRRAGADVRLLASFHTDVLEERLREGLESHRFGESPADAAALLSRQGRPVAEWRRALAALLGGNAYRSASVTPETLWRIAEDPVAAPSARAGAAAALRPTLDEAGRERLRAAASASASPRVRVVLEAAADTEDELLERALEQCHEEA